MTTNNTHPTPAWADATNAVENAKSILIVTHISPDGDAIGSLLGLANALRERGHAVETAVDDGVPDFLEFLPGSKLVKSALTSGDWDVMISVDASDEARTGKVGAYGRAHSRTVVNLDHHPTNTYFGDIFLVEPEAVSATQIITEWLNFMAQPISQAAAVPLLTGLVTDTLGFRTSNVNSSTLLIATQMMDAGASLTEVTARTLGSKTFNTLLLWRESLTSLALDGQVIEATVTQENLKKAHLYDVTDGGLVQLLITVNEAMVAVVFKELPKGNVELSFRSKPGYDVGTLAFALGGGGHIQASGATIDGPLEAAKARVMPLLQQAVKAGKLVIA